MGLRFPLAIVMFVSAVCVSQVWASDEALATRRLQQELLATERAGLDAELEHSRRECYQKLAVTPCILRAKARHRELLRQIKKQQADLNAAQRQHEATERLQAIEAKRSAMPPVSAGSLVATVSAGDQPQDTSQPGQDKEPSKRRSRPTPEPMAASSGTDAAKAIAARTAQRAAQAAKNLQLIQQRESANQKRRAEAAKRSAETKKPPASALPLPP